MEPGPTEMDNESSNTEAGRTFRREIQYTSEAGGGGGGGRSSRMLI